MKKCLVSSLALGFSLVALPFLGGCTQQNASRSNPFVNSASAEPVVSENNLAAVTETVTNAPEATAQAVTNLVAETNAPAATIAGTNTISEIEPTAETLPHAEQKPPSNLQLSPVLSEAVKLVQSGVDRSVLFNFITNTTGYFALGADEIVYLNDLGLEGNIITTMMEHDKALRELRSNAWQAAQAAASNQATQQIAQAEQPDPEAAAPSYVEPPPMEAEPVYVSDSYFYDTLSPYGTWAYVPGYGRCWRPTAAYCNPGWRPYVDRGRWVYSDCGWYWLSDYTWGATTFHYGRWFNDSRMGWCWWPDNVWAPSWVSWRYTGDYCGWAPLPPNCYYQSGFGLMYTSGSVGAGFGFGLGVGCYAFVPWGSFCAPRPYKYCLPNSSAVHVYNNSKPYNNWEGGGQGKAYNRGLTPDRVRELSRTEVRTVSVNEQSGGSRRAERIDRDGRTLTVRRPQFTSTPTDVANISGGASRPARREVVAPKPSEPGASTSSRPTTSGNSTLAPATTVRANLRNQREQSFANRTGGRVSPAASTGDSTIESKPPVTTTTRVEDRIGRKTETEPVNRTRTTPPIIARPTPQPAAPVATVATPGTIETKPSQPRVIQPNRQTSTRPTAPAQRSSIVVIGNGNNNRSSGRDYSVWNTPSQTPAPSSPRDNARNTQPTAVNAPEVADNSTAVNRANNDNGNGQSRGNYNRQDNRGNNQTYSAPQAGQVIGPAARSAPTANYNARPAQSTPTQSYSPRSQPAPQPSTARVESRPAAPAQTAAPAQSRPSAPATSQSGQNQGRPR